ncbi:MAG: hypothetical protein KatS3mg131_3122 [Candidatus Tectimicrobiota bacterium]|nr:MAG: hypothetical protein KatS3mg131_3122 [Candidatus Tectomicrobia bacterium]
MQLGILSLVNHDPQQPGSDAAILRDQVAQAVLADALGLDAFWIAEHHACDYGGIVPANAVLAGAIASATRRIRIGAGGAILTLHDPLEIAEQWAMVDCLSGGRLEFGMARAFLPFEFALFGVDMDESRARYEEAVAFLRQAWSGADLGFCGRFRQVPALGPLTPLPVQRPHPPMWVAAAMTPESFVWAGKQGFRLMVVPYPIGLRRLNPLMQAYLEAYDAAGHPPQHRRIQATYHLLLAEDTATAKRLAEAPLMHYLDSFVRAARRLQARSADYAAYGKMVTALSQLTFDGLYERQRILVGSPEDVVAVLRHITATSPITDFAFVVDFGLLDRALVRQTLTLLATAVAPAVRQQAG